MKSDSPESEVRQFYADATVPEDRVEAILSHGKSIAAERLWRRVAIASTFGFIGMIMVSSFLFVRLRDEATAAVAPAEPGNPAAEQFAARIDERPDRISPSTKRFQLIAVRSHGDRCPHCRASSEVFAGLRKSLADENIEFTFIDLRRDSEHLRQSQETFEALGLNDLVEGRDKALVAIADPTGKLHKLDASEGIDRLESHIAGLLREP